MAEAGARPAVFVDRDGTLIEEKDYLADPDGVEMLPGVVEAIRALKEGGFRVVVVTNQSGIARGLYTLEDYEAVAARVNEVLREHGATVDGTYFCPHHPDVTGDCDCRKPGTGMYRAAAEELDLDLAHSYYVGDKVTDVLAGIALGGIPILVRTGYGAEHAAAVPRDTRIVQDLSAAAHLILSAADGAG
ncbi:MAG: D-glycero-beta-D-manno-heptose 1,7-bisphosphate 7-phosphatase [Gemmatimonadota bacterium]|nr:MAG: D-glycero-beta-D-manno-heptose 1,7-bisphosphate 7-phosphatase [Gemmatimonadota bacterium]